MQDRCAKAMAHVFCFPPQSSQENLVEAAKMWPDIPPPSAQVAPLSLPMCNGCGTKGTRKEKSLLLASSFGQLSPKHGNVLLT